MLRRSARPPPILKISPIAWDSRTLDHFAQFVRGTKVPPRDTVLAATPDAQASQYLFEEIRCSTCHVQSITTAPAGTVVDGGSFTVPEALGNKIIHPFSDFLLHDIGTGDGIIQGGPPDTANKLRTSPLWGLRTKSRFMHDLKSLTLENAIARHNGEADEAVERFHNLTPQGAAATTYLPELSVGIGDSWRGTESLCASHHCDRK
jgi:CxxC motif-containing protein (DUF1111 family)